MKHLCLFLTLLLLCINLRAGEGGDPLKQSFRFLKQKSTVYELLNRISDISGFNFIYDSNIVDNERKVKLPAGLYTLEEAVFYVLGSRDYSLQLFEKYILIDKKKTLQPSAIKAKKDHLADSLHFFSVSGTVFDKIEKTPVPYCSVSIEGTGLGTITNGSGRFTLKIADSLNVAKIHLSHIGYESQRIPILLFLDNNRNIYLDQRIIPIQEVIIRLINPRKIVEEVLENRDKNYSKEPVCMTSFYREGVERKKEILTLTEGVFKIYKSSYNSFHSDDQVKLLKMRKITNQALKDTVILKMKAGLEASLLLDLMKSVPDFMEISDQNQYKYTKIDMTEYDSRLAHVVAFEQNEGVQEPLYRGKLYIDATNSALLSAEFEIQPKYISKAESMFIEKRGKNVQIHPQQILYSVSYKELNGKYYINHLRGDLYFKMKSKKQFFYNPMHIFFEMATCKIDTLDAKPFPKSERLPIRKIFSDISFQYDDSFWGDFNIILPDVDMNEAISNITTKIEESGE